MRLRREGAPVMGGLLFAVAGGWIIDPAVAAGLAPLLVLVVWFYRDPPRSAGGGREAAVSPADGKVVEIDYASHAFTGPALRIGIFMSPLDVHVNRVPLNGAVAFLRHVPGRKAMAFHPNAPEENERLYMGLQSEFGPVVVVQIAGFLARRISCWVREGDHLERGGRYGMIHFGSRVDIYLPRRMSCSVREGQRVRAGETILGVMYGGAEE
ncbi:MAG: phosphatidylserine decarboxylase [Synergistales bacterium]|nr:phosphatidylserine decarboxylase [Synergistales bacterium]